MTTPSVKPGVVVGVDGSQASRSALRWAARDAAMREVPLVIVSAVPPLVGSWAIAPVPIGVVEWARQSAQQVLDDAEQSAKDCTDGSLQVSTVMPAGAAVPSLVDLSEAAELLVVGRSGRSAVSRALLGAVSSGVLHHAHCPVAVVHEGTSPLDLDDGSAVLVGVDGSQSGDYALEVACREASLRGVDLVAVHAWSVPGAWKFPSSEFEQLSGDLDIWLGQQLAKWQQRYPGVTMRHNVIRDQPSQGLVDFPEPAQLIVVGSHGLGGFTGMLLGSVSHAVVQTAHVPVIVARRR